MLDHQHGVAQIAQALKRGEQLLVVTRVQADARLVENVQHAHQPRADLRGQADALRFAAAERAARAVECQVAQPDILQKTKPRRDLAHHVGGDFLAHLIHFQAVEKPHRLVDRQLADIHDRQATETPVASQLASAAQRHRQHHFAEPLAPTRLAPLRAHERPEPPPCRLAACLVVQPGEVGQDAVERLGRRGFLAAARKLKLDHLVGRAVEQRLLEALGQATVRLGHVHPVMRGQRLEQPVVMGNHPRAALRPRQDDALLQRLVRVADHQAFVEHRPLAQPGAGRAGAVWRVE